MSERINDLGKLQLAVLNILWSRPDATVHEVLAEFPGERKPAYTTVLTVLRNLEQRGLVAHASVEGTRMFRYRALVSAADRRNGILQDVLHRLFDGSPALLIAQLLEMEAPSRAELQRIREAVEACARRLSGTSA
ncbi:MAG TPA: BlaI/MecI/CopY family transcriptional regulator [Chthonomonadaceae bacterium]|nr:BlaI/MecI/CopY family transcriptional regulator [Chthonomonadaceae bacterium]